MKNIFKNIFAVALLTLSLTSCSKSEDDAVTGSGTLKVEFDQMYGSADLALGTSYTNSNGEVLTPSKIRYIVSNIVLTKVDGTTYTIPKASSYFIIDEATTASRTIALTNVPAGDYKSIKFGIGVDKDQWSLGATGQGDLLTNAQAAGLTWSWAAGYKFLAFEGTFTAPTVASATSYMVHTGKTSVNGTENYNYTEVTLSLPTNALVRTNITPDIHLVADVKKVVDGTNKINLTESAMVMSGAKLALVTTNLSNMFTVDHVHND